MDNTSIITQVANPKEEEILSSCQEKVSQSNSSLKKHRNRSIFSPFFCCFRDYNAEPPATNNKTCSLPPPAEENSSPPKCDQVQVIPIPMSKYLLPEVSINDYGKNCVVIDLDETLVHSSFKPISNADFIVPVEIDGTVHQVPLLTKLSPLLNLDCVFFVLQCHHNLDKPCQIEMKGILRVPYKLSSINIYIKGGLSTCPISSLRESALYSVLYIYNFKYQYSVFYV
uniref:CTD small phosphatase like n=1 Tax=Sinocyclocheilus grahami TaxID=75366 RepID=A0A672NRY2_SINGR